MHVMIRYEIERASFPANEGEGCARGMELEAQMLSRCDRAG